MPVRLKPDVPELGTRVPTSGRVRINLDEPIETPIASDDSESMDLSDLLGPAGIVGGGALIAAGLAAKKPGAIGRGLSKLGDFRQQLMLSGLAIPKAVISNIGGAAVASAERRSMNPLKQLLSGQTLKDIVAEYRAGAPGHIQAAGTATGKAMHGPGRVLGAIDEATQRAFARAGMTADEAKRITFQTPLNERFGSFGEALDSPAMRYLIPFRRTPFNVLYEGGMAFKNLKDPVRASMLAGAGAAGAAHGALTSDEQYPISLGLGAAAANRYALPYLLAASGGRALAGGTDPESVAGEALPISEYGLASGITHPTQPFTNPAAVRVLRRLLGE